MWRGTSNFWFEGRENEKQKLVMEWKNSPQFTVRLKDVPFTRRNPSIPCVPFSVVFRVKKDDEYYSNIIYSWSICFFSGGGCGSLFDREVFDVRIFVSLFCEKKYHQRTGFGLRLSGWYVASFQKIRTRENQIIHGNIFFSICLSLPIS